MVVIPQLMKGDKTVLSTIGYKLSSPLGSSGTLNPACANVDRIHL